MPEEPSNSELQRLIVRVGQDVQGLIVQMQAYVLREVYQAEQSATSSRLKRLEDEQTAAQSRAEKEANAAKERADAEASSTRQSARTTKITAGTAVAASVIGAVVSGWISSKGAGK